MPQIITFVDSLFHVMKKWQLSSHFTWSTPFTKFFSHFHLVASKNFAPFYELFFFLSERWSTGAYSYFLFSFQQKKKRGEGDELIHPLFSVHTQSTSTQVHTYIGEWKKADITVILYRARTLCGGSRKKSSREGEKKSCVEQQEGVGKKARQKSRWTGLAGVRGDRKKGKNTQWENAALVGGWSGDKKKNRVVFKIS